MQTPLWTHHVWSKTNPERPCPASRPPRPRDVDVPEGLSEVVRSDEPDPVWPCRGGGREPGLSSLHGPVVVERAAAQDV